MHISNGADKIENKFANYQITKSENNFSDLVEDKQENKQSLNLPDLGLSSALGLFTLDVNTSDEEQAPLKRKKKKPKRRFRQS